MSTYNINLYFLGNKKILGRFRTIFNDEQENEIISYLIDMEKRFFGLTINDIRSLAYQLAEKNNISHNFNRYYKENGW